MRSASKVAYERVLETWEVSVAAHVGQEIEFATELFSIADVLSEHTSVARALEDASRSAQDRQTVVAQIFHQAHAAVLEVVKSLVQETWAEKGDLAQSVALLAAQTILLGAQREALLSKTEEELYQLLRLLKEQRDLRLVLGDVQYDVAARQNLAVQLLGAHNIYTQALTARAIAKVPAPSLIAALHSFITLAAARGEHLVAAVTSALPLSEAQAERLTRILSQHYQRQVRLHISVNPEIVGGLRIHIGDEVIDGTLATRLAMVKEEIK